jgi:hypothetical protein
MQMMMKRPKLKRSRSKMKSECLHYCAQSTSGEKRKSGVVHLSLKTCTFRGFLARLGSLSELLHSGLPGPNPSKDIPLIYHDMDLVWHRIKLLGGGNMMHEIFHFPKGTMRMSYNTLWRTE